MYWMMDGLEREMIQEALFGDWYSDLDKLQKEWKAYQGRLKPWA